MSRLLGRATGLINALQGSQGNNGQQGQGGYGQQGYGQQQQGGYNGPLANSRLYGLYKMAENSMGKGQNQQGGQNPYGQQDQYGQQPPNPYGGSGSSYGPQGGASPYGPQGGASPYGPQGGASPYGPQGGASPYGPQGGASPYGPQGGSPNPSVSGYQAPPGGPSPYGPQGGAASPYGPQGAQNSFAAPPPRATSAGSGNAELSCSDFIENLIMENPVMVFSRENNADGAFVRSFFEENYTGLHVEYFDIHPDDPLILPNLVERSKTAQKYNGKKKVQHDVPFIFIDKVYIGGWKELKEMRKADIVGLLQGRR